MTGIDFSQFTEKYYEMNSETDEILPSGRQLRDGMVVLIEEPTFRKDIETLRAYAEHKAPGWEELLAEARVRNRWAKVSYIFLTKDDGVSFIGEFPDGAKRQVRMGLDFAWLVKKDSLPQNKPTVISGVADAPEYLQDSFTPPVKSMLEEAQESVTRWRDWKAQQKIVDAEADLIDPKTNKSIPKKAWIPSQDGRGLVKASSNPDIEFTPTMSQAAMREMNDRLGGPQYFKAIQDQMHAAQEEVIAEVLMDDLQPKLSPDNPYAEIEKQMLAAWKKDRLEMGLYPNKSKEG